MRLYIGLAILCSIVFLSACTNNNSSKTDTSDVKTADSATNSSIKNILFFGNSLTAGYGLDPAESFPSLIQQKIDSAGLKYKVINAGVSGETSAGGKSRLDWILKTPLDVFVLELGANDGLRGIPISETKKNLQEIIDRVAKAYPQAKLVMAGMQIPPNMGARYTNEFREMYVELATKNNMALIPFLLEGVGGVSSLNLQDGIHPNAEGAKIVAGNVWSILKDQL